MMSEKAFFKGHAMRRAFISRFIWENWISACVDIELDSDSIYSSDGFAKNSRENVDNEIILY